MKRLMFGIVGVLVLLGLSACGDGGRHSPTVISTQVFSSATFDGDVRFDPPNTFTVTQGTGPSVFAGIDPLTNSEFRAFLDFHLSGVVPLDAVIVAARLEIFIRSIQLQAGSNSIPIRIELVNFQPPTLLATDWDRAILPPLASTTIVPPIFQADVGHLVSVDVTSLMVEAQRLGLRDFQVRILEDPNLVPVPGLIEIDETANLAPLLQVSYF